MVAIRIDVGNHGPLWDGRAERAAEALAEDIRTDLAATGLRDVQQTLATHIKVRTPVLETLLNIERLGNTERVNNGSIIYRHWIEGIGSKNRARPGFPGYHAFRLGYFAVLRAIPGTVARLLPHRLRQMGGR